MDWSSVYEDAGEEEGDWEKNHVCRSIRTGMLEDIDLAKYGPLICYAFTVNYILGVGCLGIPFAFLQSGVAMGIVLVIGLSYISFVTVMWVAEASLQEVQLRKYLKSRNPFMESPLSILSKKMKVDGLSEESSEKSKFLMSSLYYSSFSVLGSSHKHVGKARKRMSSEDDNDQIVELEVTDLAYEFLGDGGRIVYQGALMLLTYVGLLAYTQVFNNTFLLQIWPGASAAVPVVLFSMIVIPLSCFDLAEQIAVQVGMSVLRFLSLGILIAGTIVAMVVDERNLSYHWHSAAWSSSEDVSASPTITLLANWSGFGMMFTTAIFSQLFQHSVPGLIRPLKEEDKKQVPRIFRCALVTTALIYIIMGSACVLYFGPALRQSVNLNFIDFAWGLKSTDSAALRFAISALGMIVVLFPALDTLSVFPLIANTLGNNLNAAFPCLKQTVKKHGLLASWGSHRRVSTILWRLAAAVPPIVASCFISDLMFSLQIAGLCGIVVALVIPALLQKQSRSRSSLLPLGSSQLGASFGCESSAICSSAVLFIAAVALLISIAQLVT